MVRNYLLMGCLLVSGLRADPIVNGGFEDGNLTAGYILDPNSNVVTTPAVFAPSACDSTTLPVWCSAFPTAPEGKYYGLLSNGPGIVNSGLTDVSILDTIPYLVTSPSASFSFVFDFLTADGLGDFFQVNVLSGNTITQLLLEPDSAATNLVFGPGICATAPEGSSVCTDTGFLAFTTGVNALSSFNGKQVQFQFLVADAGADDGFDSAVILDQLDGTGLQVVTGDVPEPATILLAAGAFAALFLRKLRSSVQ
jgi:hypothetical protein